MTFTLTWASYVVITVIIYSRSRCFLCPRHYGSRCFLCPRHCGLHAISRATSNNRVKVAVSVIFLRLVRSAVWRDLMVYPRYQSCSATESEFKPGQALFKQVLSSTHSAHLFSPAGSGFVGQPRQEIAQTVCREQKRDARNLQAL